MSKEIPAPEEGSCDWWWYVPDNGGRAYVSTVRIVCYPCDVEFRVLRDVVHPRCFACGKFKKRPYKVFKGPQ